MAEEVNSAELHIPGTAKIVSESTDVIGSGAFIRIAG
jgi:hypothetical protein